MQRGVRARLFAQLAALRAQQKIGMVR